MAIPPESNYCTNLSETISNGASVMVHFLHWSQWRTMSILLSVASKWSMLRFWRLHILEWLRGWVRGMWYLPFHMERYLKNWVMLVFLHWITPWKWRMHWKLHRWKSRSSWMEASPTGWNCVSALKYISQLGHSLIGLRWVKEFHDDFWLTDTFFVDQVAQPDCNFNKGENCTLPWEDHCVRECPSSNFIPTNPDHTQHILPWSWHEMLGGTLKTVGTAVPEHHGKL